MQTLTPSIPLCLGVDIGRAGFHLSLADLDQPPKKWSVIKFEYANPDWWRELLALVDRPAIVVAEPTGWHYLAPLAHLLGSQRPDAQLYLINHDASRRIRQAYLSRSNKTDAIDARALAFVALDIALGREPAGIRSNSVQAAHDLLTLRMHVNERARLVKLQTRLLNRIEQWAFSIWPTFADKKSTYIKAALAGAVTPAEIANLLRRGGDRRVLNFTERMLADVPPFAAAPPVVEQTIRHLVDEYRPLPDHISAADARVTSTLEQLYPLVLARWRTMPALPDHFIAAWLVACRADVITMTRDEFRAAVGAAPSRFQSGATSSGKKHRRGYRPALAALHLYAINLLNPQAADNPIARQHHRRPYLARTKTKLADLLWQVARSEEGYQFPRPKTR